MLAIPSNCSVYSFTRSWLIFIILFHFPLYVYCKSKERSEKNNEAEYLIVTTKRGQVRGRKENTADEDLGVFLGIPFAQPPIGNLRFQKPVEINNSEDIRDALNLPNSCFQFNDTSFKLIPGMS